MCVFEHTYTNGYTHTVLSKSLAHIIQARTFHVSRLLQHIFVYFPFENTPIQCITVPKCSQTRAIPFSPVAWHSPNAQFPQRPISLNVLWTCSEGDPCIYCK